MKPLSFTSAWLLFYPSSGEIVMPSHWAGFAAAFLFHCCVLPSLASEVLNQHLVTIAELHPQWILIESHLMDKIINKIISYRLYLFVCF